MSGTTVPHIPVVVIHYGAPEWCASTVDSLLASHALEPKVLVVDNGPVDASVRLQEILPPSVETVLPAQNLGYAGGANLGIRRAFQDPGNRWCLVCSHDVLVEPDCIKLMVSAAEECGLHLVGPDLGLAGRFEPQEGAVWVRPIRGWLSGTCLLIDRAVTESVGLFDPRLGSYCEDKDFGRRSAEAGFIAGIVPSARASTAGSASDRSIELVLRNDALLSLRDGGLRPFARQVARLGSHGLGHAVQSLIVTSSPAVRATARSRCRAEIRAFGSSLKLAPRMRRPIPELRSPARTQRDRGSEVDRS